MKRLLMLAAVLAAVLVLGPLQASATPPPGFTVSPTELVMTAGPGGMDYQYVTVTTSRAVVIQSPATITGDSVFSDTQSGTCWQNYESLGKQIPPHTSCTIRIMFLSPDPGGTYYGTLSVTRCVDWYKDPTYGFIVCSSFDGSQTVDLTGITYTVS